MAHYAFLDENNIVTEVIVGIDETELIEGKEPEVWYAEFRGQDCKRTSYSGSYRKNFAGIGFTYLAHIDAFVAPKPFASWSLNDETAHWEAPIPYPADGLIYQWIEESLDWEAVVFELEEK
jgi:hypothetical protein